MAQICGNCNSEYDDEYGFCPYCGTKSGEGAFNPRLNMTALIYGPPVTIRYKCEHCGQKWTVHKLGGDNSKYCPACGKQPIIKLEEKRDI